MRRLARASLKTSRSGPISPLPNGGSISALPSGMPPAQISSVAA